MEHATDEFIILAAQDVGDTPRFWIKRMPSASINFQGSLFDDESDGDLRFLRQDFNIVVFERGFPIRIRIESRHSDGKSPRITASEDGVGSARHDQQEEEETDSHFERPNVSRMAFGNLISSRVIMKIDSLCFAIFLEKGCP